ncbi:SCO family protein [Thiolinea disciformis]|uniref:SCO family protein n=1 Tax=Thiolinea disciformis TaxID=125614 RepID=UPI00036D9E67|nr:hypothetical protein [Thiolinea disciformis]
MAEKQASTLNASQKKLILIIALFFLPLFIATVWYKAAPPTFLPDAGTNNGDLITPARRLAAFEQATLTDQIWTLGNLETKWTLVHLLDAPCDEACSKSLYNTRQIRIALGKDMDRVQRVAVVKTPEIAKADSKMWESHPDMTILISHGSQDLAAQIRHTSTAPANTVYLVDPLGNLIMSFNPALAPKLMMKDLTKLLRLSHIG